MFFPVPLQIKKPNHSNEVPIANALLIATCILVHVLGLSASLGVGKGEGWLRIFTYAFVHNNFWHLIVNMWFLIVFGNPVNQRLGNKYYLMIFFGTTIFLGIFARLFLANSITGASGGIYAMIAIAIFLMPGAILEVAYLAIVPVTLLIGLFDRPKHWIHWVIRFDTIELRMYWCLLAVPILQFLGLLWVRPAASFGHLLGLACGVIALVLLPRAVTIPQARLRTS